MERLRIWERRILSACLGLGSRMLPNGTFRKLSCRLIYERYSFEKIDVFHMPLDGVSSHRYLSPIDLLTIRDAGLLYKYDRLLFYHRRVNTLDIQVH